MKDDIEKLADDALGSFNNARRAEPKPFLISRVMAAINRQSNDDNIWVRMGAIISRPSIAIAGIIVILFINAGIILLNNKQTAKTSTVQNSTAISDEFAVSTNNIYDLENPE